MTRKCCFALLMGLANLAPIALGQSTPSVAPERPATTIEIQTADCQWTAGERLTLDEDPQPTPDGEKALLVRVSGPASPKEPYAEKYSLTGRILDGRLPTDAQGAWIKKISFWFKSDPVSDAALLLVVRKGYGDRVPLKPAGWRKVEISRWGPDRLLVHDLREVALRTAAVPDGSRFSLGPLRIELTTAAAEAARWKPANGGQFTINGLWWLQENQGAYRRLPLRPELQQQVDARVWKYADYPTGGRVRFRTDSATIGLRIDHGGDSLAWRELSVMAMAGIELYEGPPGQMVFRQISRPASGSEPYEVRFGPFGERRQREFTLYLPMYAQLKSLDIELEPNASLTPPTPFAIDKPVVFYGTSFIQGGCASRASMNLPSLVGRRLGIDIINLGFAGDGRCEPAVAQLMSEIDAACFVMGPILNNLEVMRENYPRFVGQLRRAWPERPILLMSRLHSQGQAEPYEVNALVREVFDAMRAGGDRNVHWFDSFVLYKDGSEHPTVEGLHPSDLGFTMIAGALSPALAKILKTPLRVE